MVKEIVWSKKASKNRNQIIEYWNWHNKSPLYGEKLKILFDEAIKTVQKFSEIGRPTNRPDTRIKIVSHFYIIYRIKNTTIRILSIWDSRQNPTKLDQLIG